MITDRCFCGHVIALWQIIFLQRSVWLMHVVLHVYRWKCIMRFKLWCLSLFLCLLLLSSRRISRSVIPFTLLQVHLWPLWIFLVLNVFFSPAVPLRLWTLSLTTANYRLTPTTWCQRSMRSAINKTNLFLIERPQLQHILSVKNKNTCGNIEDDEGC